MDFLVPNWRPDQKQNDEQSPIQIGSEGPPGHIFRKFLQKTEKFLLLFTLRAQFIGLLLAKEDWKLFYSDTNYEKKMLDFFFVEASNYNQVLSWKK